MIKRICRSVLGIKWFSNPQMMVFMLEFNVTFNLRLLFCFCLVFNQFLSLFHSVVFWFVPLQSACEGSIPGFVDPSFYLVTCFCVYIKIAWPISTSDRFSMTNHIELISRLCFFLFLFFLFFVCMSQPGTGGNSNQCCQPSQENCSSVTCVWLGAPITGMVCMVVPTLAIQISAMLLF